MCLEEKVNNDKFLLGNTVENLVAVSYHLSGALKENVEVPKLVNKLRRYADDMTVNESKGLEVAGYFCKFNYKVQDFLFHAKLECSEGMVQFALDNADGLDYEVAIVDFDVTLTDIDLAKAMIDAFIVGLLNKKKLVLN
jgi:hypothetical protein